MVEARYRGQVRDSHNEANIIVHAAWDACDIRMSLLQVHM